MRRIRIILLLTLFALPFALLSPGPLVTAQVEAVDLSVGKAESGKEIYGQICVACHGDKAQGNELLNAPRLAGQEPWYIARQLKNFTEGIRGADPRDIYGAQMRPMALTLTTDQKIADIVAFISTLEKR